MEDRRREIVEGAGEVAGEVGEGKCWRLGSGEVGEERWWKEGAE